jgi:hypothetical protein
VSGLEIPLFPLRTVLFPGMPLPLRIFEERYKTMTRELLQSGGVFGVLLIREGREVGGSALPFEVGTTARIEEHEEVDGGRYVLACRGLRRFRLVRMLPPAPYPRGEITLLNDSRFEDDGRLREALAAVDRIFPEYFRLALSLTDQWARPMALPRHPHHLVNFLAPWLKTDELTKQRLLEIEPAAERVEHLAEVLLKLQAETLGEARERERQRFHGLGAQN